MLLCYVLYNIIDYNYYCYRCYCVDCIYSIIIELAPSPLTTTQLLLGAFSLPILRCGADSILIDLLSTACLHFWAVNRIQIKPNTHTHAHV